MASLWYTEMSLSLTGREACLTSVLWSSPLGKARVLRRCEAWGSGIKAQLCHDKSWTIENKWNTISSRIGELIGIFYFRIQNGTKRIVWLFLYGEHQLSGEKVVIYRYRMQSVFITLVTFSFFTGSAFARISGALKILKITCNSHLVYGIIFS